MRVPEPFNCPIIYFQASQIAIPLSKVEPNSKKKGLTDAELAEMTAMMEDDDDFGGFEEEEEKKEKTPKKAQVVFMAPKPDRPNKAIPRPSSPVFARPAPTAPKSAAMAPKTSEEVERLKSELARLKSAHEKAASERFEERGKLIYLKSELQKSHEALRQAKEASQREIELKNVELKQMEASKIKAIEDANSERDFLRQDVRQLQESLKRRPVVQGQVQQVI